jgi:hypothetical protein
MGCVIAQVMQGEAALEIIYEQYKLEVYVIDFQPFGCSLGWELAMNKLNNPLRSDRSRVVRHQMNS